MSEDNEQTKKQAYWYRFYHRECVLCGVEDDSKERVYDEPKPDDVYERHIFIQFACGTHFL